MLARRTLLCAAAFAPLAGLAPGLAAADAAPVFAEDALAIDGYDPVAYFLEGRPRRGSDDHLLEWRGALWCFDSAENRAAFEADPRAFAPRYGGYCAYALARGALVPSVPEAWTIHEGGLYLNASLAVRTLWRADLAANIRAADARWPEILG